MKIILRIFIFLFVIIFFLVGYLSLIGLKTERFNSQISQKIKKIDGNFEIELKEIKIILDPFKFQLNAKTIGPKIINKDAIIEIEYLKTKIPLVSLFNKNFLIKNIEISTKSLKAKDVISLFRNFQNTAELYILEKIIKKGYLIADINLNFDSEGNIKNNFKFKGVLKDTKISITKKYELDNLNLAFNYDQSTLDLQDIKLSLNKLNLVSKNIEIKNLNNKFEIKGDFENKNLVLNDNNIDLFIKPFFKDLDVKKIKFNSKNNFSFELSQKFKVNKLSIVSKINLQELFIVNNLKVKSFFPKINKNIKLLNHNLEINYGKESFTINGNGDFQLQNNIDKISYLIKSKNNKYNFSSSIYIKDNPFNISFFNYEKNEKNELIIDLKGKKKFDNKITFDSIAITEKTNKINIEGLTFDKNFKITNLKKAKINLLDKENKKNQFYLSQKKNSYLLKGSSFNANNLTQQLIDAENDFNIINKNFKLDIDILKLVLDKNHTLDNFKGNLSFNNQKIINGKLIGNFSKNKKLSFTVKTNGNEKITTLYLDKAEPIIKRYKFIKGFKEGSLDFYSSKKGNQSTSTLKVYDFKLNELPLLTKILTLASLQGIADILSGEGIRFDEFEMNFTNKNDLMNIDEIYAIGPAISILMDGYVEKNRIVSLRGTLVPATTINKFIGSLPVLGKILVGSKTGEGVFGVSFKIKGPPKKLETSVNPIKTLTPRFITRTLEKIKKTN